MGTEIDIRHIYREYNTEADGLANQGANGVTVTHNWSTVCFLLAVIAFNSTRARPIGPVISMGFYGWIISLLCDSREIYFWSCGMTATLGQAIAHNLSREAGTLAVLQGSSMDMSAYELSHVTFFPNLLFQSIHSHFGL